MKATLRIPCAEQYAYIELETEVTTAKEAVDIYFDASNLYKDKHIKQQVEKSRADEVPFVEKPKENKVYGPKREDYLNK